MNKPRLRTSYGFPVKHAETSRISLLSKGLVPFILSPPSLSLCACACACFAKLVLQSFARVGINEDRYSPRYYHLQPVVRLKRKDHKDHKRSLSPVLLERVGSQ